MLDVEEDCFLVCATVMGATDRADAAVGIGEYPPLTILPRDVPNVVQDCQIVALASSDVLLQSAMKDRHQYSSLRTF